MKKAITIIIGVLALSMSIFHIYSGGIKLFPALQQRSIHMGFAFSLIFLTYPLLKKEQKNEIQTNILKVSSWIINIILAMVSLYVGYYIMNNHLTIPMELLSPSFNTLCVGVIVILLTLEVTRRALGCALLILSILVLIYSFFGVCLHLFFYHTGFYFVVVFNNV